MAFHSWLLVYSAQAAQRWTAFVDQLARYRLLRERQIRRETAWIAVERDSPYAQERV